MGSFDSLIVIPILIRQIAHLGRGLRHFWQFESSVVELSLKATGPEQ